MRKCLRKFLAECVAIDAASLQHAICENKWQSHKRICKLIAAVQEYDLNMEINLECYVGASLEYLLYECVAGLVNLADKREASSFPSIYRAYKFARANCKPEFLILEIEARLAKPEKG